MNDTVPELITHWLLEPELIEKVTGLPESPPVAVGVYVSPPTVAAGAVDVNVMT